MAAAASPATVQAQPIETIVQDDALMLHGTDEEVRLGMQRSRELGIDRVRLTAGWSVIAPHPDSPTPPEFDATDPAAYPDGRWDNLDRAVRLAHEAGLKPMVDIAFWAPRWAAKDNGIDERAAEEIDPVRYAEFAQAVARRYSGTWVPAKSEDAAAQPAKDPDGTVVDRLLGRKPQQTDTPPPAAEVAEPLPRVDTFTIWNEPNHAGFLKPQWVKVDGQWKPRSADIYRAMVRAAYPAIKGAAPDARILIGGTASMGSSTPGTGNVPPLRFLRALACVDEQLQPVTTGDCAGYERLPGDGWSHHPYSLRTTPDVDTKDQDKLPVAATRRLAATLRALVAAGRLAPSTADLYMTEYGYETNLPDPGAPFSLDQQAGLLAWAEYIASTEPAVRSWPQFQLYDRPDAAPRAGMRPFADWHSGLYFNDGTAKPAAATYATPIHTACTARGGRRWAMIWGRLRGRGSNGVAEVQARRGEGAWRTVTTSAAATRSGSGPRASTSVAATDSIGVRRYVKHAAGTVYRLQWAVGGEKRLTATSAPVGDCSRLKRAGERPRTKRR